MPVRVPVTKKAVSASPQDISECFCRLVAIPPRTLDDNERKRLT